MKQRGVIMKCAACGYEKRDDEFHTVEAVLVKSGKKKGVRICLKNLMTEVNVK